MKEKWLISTSKESPFAPSLQISTPQTTRTTHLNKENVKFTEDQSKPIPPNQSETPYDEAEQSIHLVKISYNVRSSAVTENTNSIRPLLCSVLPYNMLKKINPKPATHASSRATNGMDKTTNKALHQRPSNSAPHLKNDKTCTTSSFLDHRENEQSTAVTSFSTSPEHVI